MALPVGCALFFFAVPRPKSYAQSMGFPDYYGCCDKVVNLTKNFAPITARQLFLHGEPFALCTLCIDGEFVCARDKLWFPSRQCIYISDAMFHVHVLG